MWFKAFVLVALVGHISCQNDDTPVILRSPELLEQPSSEIMITLRDSVRPILRDLAAQVFPNRGAKLNAVASALKAATALSQAPVIAALRPFKVEFEPFWVTNKIYIKNGNPALVKFLQTLSQIREIAAPRLPGLPPFNPIEGVPPNGTEWNVNIIHAPEVWEMGSDGAGVVVYGIDTGVRYTHSAIKNSWVGAENKGWFDPWYKQAKPSDLNGHGTHTVIHGNKVALRVYIEALISTVLGQTGTGVAPGAQWMACRACETAGCPEQHLIACGQFCMCPTDPDGRNSDCTKAPHIVTNSWGGGQNEDFYDDVISAWNTVGIIPIFAIGNDGPKCETSASPGDRDGVLSVGATDKMDKIAKFSSRGPRKAGDGMIKPEIVAPGHKVNSAFHFSDNAYRVLSGTSMACPAVAGATALLVAKNPNLTLEEAMKLFYDTADRDLPASGTTCGNSPDSEYPNEVYGYGRINVARAYKMMTSQMSGGANNEPTIRSTNVTKS
ncbi:Bacillopeptidase F [Orchesella cincta]|uniref:Bacillopeptidase F n=1 Tax=Orchesella cincta TaxID=48709 RepID=A0A1D2NMW3_ORCCI|nr:Bacillopeptidase F [Orchesella cincta]